MSPPKGTPIMRRPREPEQTHLPEAASLGESLILKLILQCPQSEHMTLSVLRQPIPSVKYLQEEPLLTGRSAFLSRS